MESKDKTPRELDLEVMDRRPDIIPKVGDWVKIKSREWYEKWKQPDGYIYNVGSHIFSKEKAPYCGRVYKVEKVSGVYYYLEGAPFKWVTRMFEQVNPQEEYIVHKSYFGEIVVPIEKCINVKGVFQGEDEQFTLPNNKGTIPYSIKEVDALRAKWLPKKEPKLKIIKTNQLIKLEKL